MASISQTPETALLQAITHLYPFPFPYTRIVNLEETLRRYTGDQRTATLIQRTNSCRRNLIDGLSPSIHEPRYILNLIDRYLPNILQFAITIQSQNEILSRNTQLIWAWGSGLDDRRGRTNVFETNEMEKEVIMSLATKAIALVNCAVEIINQHRNEQGWSQLFPQAADLFNSAAGIFRYLSQDRILRLMNPDSLENPPESNRFVCECLMHYCLAQSQQLAIAKSLTSGKAKFTMLAKLCFGVVHEFEQFVIIGRSQAPSFYEKFPRPMLVHVAFHQFFFRAIGFKFLALACFDAGKYGEAVAYMNKANLFLQTRKDSSSPGLPPLSGPLDTITHALLLIQKDVSILAQTYAKDNQTIYFDTVPSSESLPAEPEKLVFMEPKAFEIPEHDLVPLPLVDATVIDDEKYAREIQAKIDAGEL